LLALQREQIAILKAFGFTNRQIVFHYLKFALVMVAAGTVLGGVAGVILGHQLVGMYHRFFRFPDLSFRLDHAAFPLALLVSAGAATLGVFGAVRRAARLPPAEAMRPEPPASYRPAFVRIGHNHLRRQLGIQGLPAKGLHNRVIDEASHQLTLPANGLVMSAKLAEALDVKVGNELVVEVLEGKRPLRRVPLVELAEDFSGVAAYVERH